MHDKQKSTNPNVDIWGGGDIKFINPQQDKRGGKKEGKYTNYNIRNKKMAITCKR